MPSSQKNTINSLDFVNGFVIMALINKDPNPVGKLFSRFITIGLKAAEAAAAAQLPTRDQTSLHFRSGSRIFEHVQNPFAVPVVRMECNCFLK